MITTGERSSQADVSITPIFCQHLAAYEYAEQFVKDKFVLDLGCGEGYGSALLAASAKKVIGVDYSKAAIEKAQNTYSLANLEFMCGSIDTIKFANENFDVVCCFQLIEHLRHPEMLLHAVANWLKPQGIFVLTTPNIRSSIIIHPYHFREYNKEELASFLKLYFSKVQLFGLGFSSKVAAFREKRRSQSQRLLRIDPLKLHLLLPRFIRQNMFDFVAAKLSKKIHLEDVDLIEGISTKDYWITPKDVDLAIDLVCLSEK